MKKGLVCIVMLLCIIIVSIIYTHFYSNVVPYEGFTELKSYTDNEDIFKNKSDNRNRVLFFYMTGCPHCDKVISDWKKYSNSADVVPYHFEVNTAPNTCKKYGINSFPQWRVLDHSGRIISKDRPF